MDFNMYLSNHSRNRHLCSPNTHQDGSRVSYHSLSLSLSLFLSLKYLYTDCYNVLKQALLPVHVKHGYVFMGPIRNKNMYYIVIKTLGFDWLKNQRGVILVMPEQKVYVRI